MIVFHCVQSAANPQNKSEFAFGHLLHVTLLWVSYFKTVYIYILIYKT